MPSTRAAVLKENKLRPLKNHILTEQNLYYLNNSTVNKSVTWPFLSFDGYGQKFNYRYCPYFLLDYRYFLLYGSLFIELLIKKNDMCSTNYASRRVTMACVWGRDATARVLAYCIKKNKKVISMSNGGHRCSAMRLSRHKEHLRTLYDQGNVTVLILFVII